MGFHLFADKISLRAMSVVCRRMGMALRAGLDIRRVCEQEFSNGHGAYNRVMRDVHDRLKLGTSFAESVRAQGQYFPALFRTMAQVGERSGKLPEVLLKLADHYERLLTLRSVYLMGILWPAINLAAALLIVGVLIWVMQPLSQMVGQDVDILGFGLVGTSGLLIYIGLLIMTVLALVAAWKYATGEGAIGQNVQRLALRVPLLGKAIVAQVMAHMSWSMAMIADSDMASRTIAKTTLETSGNVYYQSFAPQIDDRLRQGKELHEAFRATQGFPDDFVQVLQTGELTGTLVESLKHLSQDYEDRAKSAWAVVAVAAAMFTWAAVAGLLIFLIFRIFIVSYLGTINELLPK